MDEEDRTPMPQGFDEKIWRKADEIHHAMALVAKDEECVKIIYAALATAPASAAEPVKLTYDERHIGVILEGDPVTAVNRVSVKEWTGDGGRITFGIFMGNHRWAECSLEPEDAAKVAALIMGKPAVKAKNLTIDT